MSYEIRYRGETSKLHILGEKREERSLKKTGAKGFQFKSKPDGKMVERQEIRGQGREKKCPNAIYLHIHTVKRIIVY